MLRLFNACALARLIAIGRNFDLPSWAHLESIWRFNSTVAHGIIPKVTSQLPPLARGSLSFEATCNIEVRLKYGGSFATMLSNRTFPGIDWLERSFDLSESIGSILIISCICDASRGEFGRRWRDRSKVDCKSWRPFFSWTKDGLSAGFAIQQDLHSCHNCLSCSDVNKGSGGSCGELHSMIAKITCGPESIWSNGMRSVKSSCRAVVSHYGEEKWQRTNVDCHSKGPDVGCEGEPIKYIFCSQLLNCHPAQWAGIVVRRRFPVRKLNRHEHTRGAKVCELCYTRFRDKNVILMASKFTLHMLWFVISHTAFRFPCMISFEWRYSRP